MKYNIQDLADALSKKTGLSRSEAELFVRHYFEIISNAVRKSGIVKIKGFGTFKLVEVSERESIDVNTGQRILINSHSKLTFAPDAQLRDHVNKPFADFETVVLNEGVDLSEMERIEVEEPVVEEPVVEESLVEKQESEESPQPEPASIEEAKPAEESKADEAVAEPQEEEIEQPEEPQPEEEQQPKEPQQEQQPEEQPVEEETVSIESLKEETEEKTPQRKSHWGKAVIICIAALILLLGSYVAGFYQLIPLEELFRPAVAPIEETQTAPEPAPVVQMSDTLIAAQPDTLAAAQPVTLAVPITEPQPPADPMAAAQEAAKQYPQVRGGKYLIVGTKSVHVMTRTDNLYKLARTTYGSNAMVQYIIVYNQFKDPDVIPPGYEIKLPELVEKK